MLFSPTFALLSAFVLGFSSPDENGELYDNGPEPMVPAASVSRGAPATLFTNATFYLGDARGTRATAILVQDGRVVEFGSEHQFAERRVDSDWNVVNLGGGYVVPGLQDAHCNVQELGRRLAEIDLVGCEGTDDILERIEQAGTFAEGEWVLARGWEPRELPGPDSDLGARLNARFPRNPVRLLHTDGNVGFLNKRALGAAAIEEKASTAIPGGRVSRGEDGRPTGLLFGRALDKVEAIFAGDKLVTLKREMLAAQELLLSFGITAVHDMGITRDSEKVYRELIKDEDLRMRVIGYLDGRQGLLPEWLKRGPVAPDGQDLFCIRGVALQADGSLSTRTASLLDGYLDAPRAKAEWLPSESQLRERIASAVAVGLQPAVQATGDRACRSVLDVFEEIGIANPGAKRLRMRLEGALVVSSKDWARFPGLEVLPSMQPIESMSPWVERRLSPDLIRGAFVWRDVAPTIGRISFGSRAPARSPNPLLGLHAVRLLASEAQEDPSESAATSRLVSARAALAGYTMGAAHAARQDNRRGRLFEGYGADMTVFDKDPVEGTTADLLDAKVTTTIVNGEVVWRAPR